MILAVVGSRGFNDSGLVNRVLLDHWPDEIVTGGAGGPDSWAEAFARIHRLPCRVFYPDWNKFGKKAGALRNKQIVDYCDQLIAFWDGTSKGTLISIELAKKAGKLKKVYTE